MHEIYLKYFMLCIILFLNFILIFFFILPFPFDVATPSMTSELLMRQWLLRVNFNDYCQGLICKHVGYKASKPKL